MNLTWIKCQGQVWCKLSKVNLDHAHFDSMAGVYVIWHGGSNASAVRIGQGVVRDRLIEHRSDSDVQEYANLELYVTWAQVPAESRNGVESYLAQQLNPLVGERFPDAVAIPVNLPWGK